MKQYIKLTIASISLAALISGCASSGGPKKAVRKTKAKTESVSDIGKKELGNDLEARLARARVYTDRNSIVSRMKGDEPDVRCRFNGTKEEMKDWPQMLKVGYACAFEKNWPVLYKLGQQMSIEHIDSPWGPYFLSLVSEEAGDMPRAIWMIGLAARKSPDNSVIEFQKARLLWKADQRDSAFHAAKKAYELDSNLIEAAFLMAQVYLSDYQFDKAEEYFSKVLKVNKRVFTATIGMAESLAQQDKYDKAIPYFETALRLKKERTDIALRIADIYENKLKDLRRALSWYERVIATFPEDVISREKQQVQDKMTAVIAKIEQQKNPAPKKAVATKAEPKAEDSSRTPASTETNTEESAGGAQ